jgi:pimeloyl-ACP methyl ester carboxylesterase
VRAVEPTSIRVPGADGLSLHALEWSREGTPLVFLHGFSNEAHVWDDAAPAVAPYYRTIAFDLRGHGDSDRDPEARYDYDFHVADLESALAALEIDRLVLVGHSLGGRVAMRFAGEHPNRLAGLVIVDSAPELDVRGTVRISVDLQRGGASGGDGLSFASESQYRDVLTRAYPEVSRPVLERMARHMLRRRADGRFEPKLDPAWFRARASADEASAKVREERLAKEMWEALAALPCPALVVRGAASDVMSPEVADRMADEVLRHGRLAIVARAGHSVMLDNPEGFTAALTGFVLGDD